MSFPAARLTDTALCPAAPKGVPKISKISSNVASRTFINHLPAALLGSVLANKGVLVTGSSRVYVENRPLHRSRIDRNSYAGFTITGSPNTFVG
ncbi:hypothetical protein ACQ4M3_19125 [Leptolyngbya sp. AN03gr2]|uniref:hypothetical protein n=1 Tax=Leptolyngbya sp. AN03gr2 TaxID=3423364 RepID=UPI003D31AA47